MSDQPQKLLFIDVETTGTDPFRHGLTQISGCVQIGNEVTESFDLFVRPFSQDVIDPRALEVTGMDKRQFLPAEDPDFLAVEGQLFVNPEEAYATLHMMLANHVDQYDKNDKLHFVGYNSHSFDMPFLRRFWEKNGDRYFGSWFWYPSLDVMLVWAQILQEERSQMGNFKLATVAEHCGIKVDKDRLHDSGYDIDLTRQLWLKACDILRKGQSGEPAWEQGKLFDF